MKTEITTEPNRDRGYDARVYRGNKWTMDCVHSVNAPSEAKARALANEWIKANPVKRIKRARCLSEGTIEALEAARNEERFY